MFGGDSDPAGEASTVGTKPVRGSVLQLMWTKAARGVCVFCVLVVISVHFSDCPETTCKFSDESSGCFCCDV